jgi:predicted nucleic acid-binding protein
MALYLDTSCLLKVFFLEPETARTLELISAESEVVVSSLARLETFSQIQARVAGGLLSSARAERLRQRIVSVLELAPYTVVRCPADVFDIAEGHIEVTEKSGYCRTLDRLHLATMEAIDVRRILTNDDMQATAARALGMEVLVPR